MIKVLKFGGASIRDSKRIKNVTKIIKDYNANKVVIVFSAIANITNLLEELVELHFNDDEKKTEKLSEVKKIHFEIMNDLFTVNHKVFSEIEIVFNEISEILSVKNNCLFSKLYDKIVSKGELLSSIILSNYLFVNGLKNFLYDAREIIKTDSKFQNAKINWLSTEKNVKKAISSFPALTQGFIASDDKNNTTTLGREGSDFTAAIISSILNVDEVIIWKDVDGVLNADPRYFDDSILLKKLSYSEAIELAFYGAKVIHPRTIQPLQAKNIPLSVRSFINCKNQGTVINNFDLKDPKPSFIIKENQVLISISDTNLSFIVEEHLSLIFNLLDKYDISLNLMQNSAVSFSICVDNTKHKIPNLIEELSEKFKVFYNDNVILLTIRHYNSDSINKAIKDRKILLEQKSRNTVQFIVS